MSPISCPGKARHRGLSQETRPRVLGIGKGAALVPEKFALEQRIRHGRKLSATNGPALRRLKSCSACAISSLPEPLSPRISTDACDCADTLDQVIEHFHDRRCTEHGGESRTRIGHALQPLHLTLELMPLHGPSQHHVELFGVEGLGEEIVGARTHSL